MGAAAIGIGAVAAAAAGGYYYVSTQGGQQRTTTTSSAGPIRIDFFIWQYGVQMVQDNVARYNAAHPESNVVLSSVPQETYGDDVISRFSSAVPTDILYSDVNYQILFEPAGWIAPAQDYFPEITKYKADITPGYLPGFLNKAGKMYGLSYYGDYTCYLYNSRILSQAGITAPAQTWDDVITHAQQIQQKVPSVKFPLAAFFGSYGFWQTFYNFMQGINGPNAAFFDKDLNPIFDTPGGPVFKTIRWLVDAINKYKVMTPDTVNYDDPTCANTMGAGTHAYMWEPRYDFIGTNTSPQKEAGNIKQALNPGSGYASCWMRPYNMTTSNVKRGKDAMQAQWSFQQYFGGKTDDKFNGDYANGAYRVAKRIATDLAVGFVYDPLWSDPDVVKAYNSFGDINIMKDQAQKIVLHQTDGLTKYWTKWSGGFVQGPARTTITALMLGQKPNTDNDIMNALADLAKQWNDLKASSG
ncbi:MAG: carbohydrate ABC transporter substrate-binding protein [Thaumarchaeota archaeon]|nr:MAG: carbohydrate ABC transporter substrate-binding protein [Nitrososphaerota archaeon]TLY16475.1 MAG: carbohydrate ABC transporter substrate-binding protein [Nitrososphaerota archaeon]TMP98746.1 MAG: carbohydrate ABC transporter substrate-binding protein [Nitrososphaerota archaeon]